MYVSAHGRARVVVILLIVGAVISLLVIPSHLLDLYVTPIADDQEITDNPLGFLALALTGVLGLATVAVYIATVIVFLMWLYRASNNVAAFGEPLQHSSGWAVGSFFVPIMNLFVPYQAVKDVWKKSDPAAADSMLHSVSPPGFFPAWWGFWLASNFASNIYFRMTLADAPADGAALVGILAEILSIAAAAFAIQVVRDIDRRQTERALVQQQAHPIPPPPPVFEQVQSPPESTVAPAPADTTRLPDASTTSDLPKPPELENPGS
jgi:uncharacterized protein DUF4328